MVTPYRENSFGLELDTLAPELDLEAESVGEEPVYLGVHGAMEEEVCPIGPSLGVEGRHRGVVAHLS